MSNDEVPLEDMQALLAELEGVGGHVSQDVARPYSRKAKGTIGSTSVLDEQQNRFVRNRRSSLCGVTASSTSPSITPPPAASGGASNPSARGVGKPHVLAPNSISGTAFSTYATSPSGGGFPDAEPRNQRVVPLGVRLAPLGAPGAGQTGGLPAISPTKGPLDSIAPHAPSLQQQQQQQQHLPSLTKSLNPYPALNGGAVGASLAKLPPASMDVLLRERMIQQEQDSLAEASLTAAANTHPDNHQSAFDAATSKALKSTSATTPEEYREANFLPIMCARYLRPEGLTPRGRWGHTLTSIDSAKMFMFGGMDAGGDTADLFEFDTGTIAWDPAFIAGGGLPAARYGHAACAYEGRYLIISGGACQNATQLFGDIHMFDISTCEWSCLWDGTKMSTHAPSARFGHTMVLREDRLYIYGGRVMKSAAARGALSGGGGSAGESGAAPTTTLANADVYVFSLNTLRWRRRLRSGGASRKTEATEGSEESRRAVNPVHRAHHAACGQGDMMYINGGSGAGGAVLNDTWALHLTTGEWQCLHTGASADAIPREKHDMFVCGEAVLLVGGCSASMFNERVAGKFTNFVSVMPLIGQQTPCWIPVAMGNVSTVAPNKKSFAAAFHGGFVYVFGGVCGSEPATNAMVRFLAADGYVSVSARAAMVAGDNALRTMMHRLRDKPGVPCDVYIVAGASAGQDGGKSSGGGGSSSAVGFHKVFLQHRAPELWVALQACRSESWSAGNAPAASLQARRRNSNSMSGSAVMDTIMQKLNDTDANEKVGGIASPHPPPSREPLGVPPSSSSSSSNSILAYYTQGNSRVQGLPVPLTSDELACINDFICYGGLRAEFRLLLEEEEPAAAAAATGEEKEEADDSNSMAGGQRTRLTRTLQSIRTAAQVYKLPTLCDICEGLLAGSARHVAKARTASTAQLRKDLLNMLSTSASPNSLATMTALFVDPHTQQQSGHALHPLVLMAASTFFADLLRPLYTGEKTSFQVGPVAAKVTVSSLIGSTSKRAVLVGPVAVPKLAIQPILRFLYTQQLHVPREVALETMIGAHLLGLSQLQAYAESIVAREEVNYDTCCSFYYLARRYGATLLEEMSLLTAVSGYAEVRHNVAYLSLSDEDKLSIDAVANELGSATWVPPPQPTAEMKPAGSYEARWDAAAPRM